MKVLVLGWYNHHNCGDESYKETFKMLFPHYSFTFVDRLKPDDVNECEAIVLGGGNVLRKQFIEPLSKIKDKPIYGFSIGIEDAPAADLTFFKHIYARDERTLNFLKLKGVSCSFCPDAALILKGDEQAGAHWLKKNFQHERYDLYSKVVTVVINGYILNGSVDGLARDAFNFIKFSYDLARIADEVPASFVFIPFGSRIPSDDRIANAWVASKCKFWNKNFVAFNPLSFRDALNVISASNLVISSRLHSSIFSFASGTPFVDITHHDKNRLFLEMVGKTENSVNFWNFNGSTLKEKVHKLLNNAKHDEHQKFRELIWKTVNEIHFD
jgi:polysaccharide pyruvyl transferase WcaK-like protein